MDASESPRVVKIEQVSRAVSGIDSPASFSYYSLLLPICRCSQLRSGATHIVSGYAENDRVPDSIRLMPQIRAIADFCLSEGEVLQFGGHPQRYCSGLLMLSPDKGCENWSLLQIYQAFELE